MRTIFHFLKSVFRPKNLFHYDNILSLGIFFVVLWGFGSVQIEFLNPISDAFSDVELTDIVFSQFDKNDEYRETINGDTEMDTNIVLVNIGNLGRGEIGDLINQINLNQPKVIGVDIRFGGPKEDSIADLYLAEAFANTENLVLVGKAHGVDTTSMGFSKGIIAYDEIDYGYDLFFQHATSLACVNVLTQEEKEDQADEFPILRKVMPRVYIKNQKDTVNFLGLEVLKYYMPEKIKEVYERNRTSELVNFIGNMAYQDKAYFKAYDWDEILYPDEQGNPMYNPKDIEGKIVLLGFMGENIFEPFDEDRFFTPMNPKYIGKAHKDMYGVVVHANFISMVLKGNYINEMSSTLGIVLGIIIAYLVFAVYRPIYFDYKVWYDGVTKLIGIIVVFVIMALIGYVFWIYDYEIKFHPIFLGVVLLAGDYLEIYYGLGKNIARKLKRKKKLN